MHGVERTGVRFVLSNAADPSRADEYSAWYDTYGAGITRPGFLANAFRFENPSAAGNDDDPRYAAIYDIVTPDPATAGRGDSSTELRLLPARLGLPTQSVMGTHAPEHLAFHLI